MNDVLGIKKIYRRKAILLFVIAFLGVLAYIFFLIMMLQAQATARQDQNNVRFFSSTIASLSSNSTEMYDLVDDYHKNNDHRRFPRCGRLCDD